MHLTFLTAETSHSFFYCRILSEKFSVIWIRCLGQIRIYYQMHWSCFPARKDFFAQIHHTTSYTSSEVNFVAFILTRQLSNYSNSDWVTLFCRCHKESADCAPSTRSQINQLSAPLQQRTYFYLSLLIILSHPVSCFLWKRNNMSIWNTVKLRAVDQVWTSLA